MARVAFRLWVQEGQLDEYVRLHAEVWPDLLADMTDAGIHNYSIWADGLELFGSYECDDPEAAANRLFHAAIKLLMAARSDLLWIHGGVAARGGRATLLCGHSGAGKSTLVADLLARGWTYFSDEFAVVDPCNATVFPFPITPYMRVSNERRLAEVEDVQHMPKIFVETAAHAVGRTAVPIDGVFFLSYAPQSKVVQVVDCSPAEGVLEMLQNSLSIAPSREQEIRRLCDLMSRVPSARLSYTRARDATDRIGAGFARSGGASFAVARSSPL